MVFNNFQHCFAIIFENLRNFTEKYIKLPLKIPSLKIFGF